MTISIEPSAVLRRMLRLPRVTGFASPRAGLIVSVALVSGLYLLLLHDLFTNLGGYWLKDWDEARHIANAMEMLRRGDWLVNTYRGGPDFYNLKPPASMWAIMLSVQAFGASAFTVRLPSALATVLTCALCTTVAWRWRGPVAAVIATAAFGSSQHMVDLHSGRTADPDALFILFMTVSVFSIVWAARHPWLTVVATTSFSLAFLTKSFHAVLALAFVAGVTLVRRRSSAVRLRHLLVSLAGFVPLVAWAIARYCYDGLAFFKAMLLTDVLSRSEAPMEGHTGGPDYYVANLQVTFGPWLLALGLGLAVVLGSVSWTVLRRRLTTDEATEGTRRFVALGVWVLVVIAAFSAVVSKLPWYGAPAVPALCVLVGVAVATALPRVAKPAAALILVVCVTATWLGQLSVMQERRTEQSTSLQLALSQLQGGQLAAGQHLYVDTVLAGWQQSMVALVDMFSDAAMTDGNESGYRADASADPAILVQEGSPAFTTVMAGHPKVLVSYMNWKIVERTTPPSP